MEISDEYKANSFIATTGLKLTEDVSLFNMITKPTLYSIQKFDHQWLNTQTAIPFSLQIISSPSVARLASLKNLCRNQAKRILSQDSSLKNSFSINSTRK